MKMGEIKGRTFDLLKVISIVYKVNSYKLSEYTGLYLPQYKNNSRYSQ